MSIKLNKNQKFNDRREISALLGGDIRKGITNSNKVKDYFYQKDNKKFYMHTGIGRTGHQDSVTNNMYKRNIDVLSHKHDKKVLLVFDKQEPNYLFAGKYKLIETHQNIQPDVTGKLRRVFAFNLEHVSDTCSFNK